MNLKETIIAHLREAILNGEYPPGGHLGETALSRRFGVSRTPIREVLHLLEKEGLVHIVPGVGARAAKRSVDDILKIYDVLIVLEGAACKFACTEITEEEIRRLQESNHRMEKALNEDDPDRMLEFNNTFHWLITEASRNSYLIDLRANFRRLVDPVTRLFPSIPGQVQSSIEEHEDIIIALRRRNPFMADFIMKEHLEKAKKNLKRHLEMPS